MGVQVVARYFYEATLFRVAAGIEADESFKITRPPVD